MEKEKNSFEKFVSKAVRELKPTITGFIFDSTEIKDWMENTEPLPSRKEIDAKIVELEAEYEAKSYQRDRQYPRLGEQLDMLFHDMTAGKGTKDGEWYKAVAKVKTDNPKSKE